MRQLVSKSQRPSLLVIRRDRNNKTIMALTLSSIFTFFADAYADESISYRKASECISTAKLESLGAQQETTAMQIHAAISAGATIRADLCDSLRNVIAIISQGNSSSGRQLEKDRKISPALALREYQSSISQADISQDIATATRDSRNQSFKTLMEAVALHDNGKYEARDHILAQLEKR